MCGISERELYDQDSRFGCDINTISPASGEATRTMPAICHVAGAMAANEVIKRIAGVPETALRGEETVCSMIAYQAWRTELPRRADCRLPHAQWRLEDVSTGANETTLSCLAGLIAIDLAQAQVRSEIPWTSYSICGSCCRRSSVRRFARVGSFVGNCKCGAALTTAPQGMRSVIPVEDLKSIWDQPIASLGIDSGEAIGFLQGDQWVYFFTPDCCVNQKTQKVYA